MPLLMDLTPQTEAWINAEAQQQGLSPVDVARHLIEERAAAATRPPIYKTPQERILAMDLIAERNADLPILPDSAFDRETIYEDRL